MIYHRSSKSTQFSLYPLRLESSNRKNMDRARVNYEEKTAIHELTQGIQMAKQLIRVNLLHSPEARELLIKNILSSYDKALFLLKSPDSAGQQPPAPALQAPGLPESPIFITSPGSEEFEYHDQPFTIQQGQNVISKKRKLGPTTWEDEVRICSGNGLEDDTDDGYHWRKYGQKDILGAKFPRSYYRCSYRKVQKCMATKQVQRTDEDPTVSEITYKGKHTCSHGAHSASPPPPIPSSPERQDIPPTYHHHHHQPSPPNPGATLSNLRASLSVDTSDLGGVSVPSSYSSPSTSSFGLMEDNYHQFQFPNCYADELWQVYSPPFISPATSESNFFTEWGSSPSSSNFPDVDPDFEFIRNSLF